MFSPIALPNHGPVITTFEALEQHENGSYRLIPLPQEFLLPRLKLEAVDGLCPGERVMYFV